MKSFSIDRILVALEPSSGGRGALDAAVYLAARYEAEVLGLFVENIDLVRLSELPGAEEVVHRTGSARRLDSSSLERALRTQRVELERSLSIAAAATKVRWSVRVTRGRVLEELRTASRGVDVVVLGGAGRLEIPWSPNAASSDRRDAARVPSSRDADTRRRVLVLFDGTESAFRALEIASRAASEGEDRALFVAISDEDEDVEQRSRLRRRLEKWMRDSGHEVRFLHLANSRVVEALCRLVGRMSTGTLVLPSSHPLAEPERFADLLRRAGCLTVLVH